MAEQERGRVLYLVIPCYNEEEVLPETSKRLTAKLGAMIEMGLISEDSKIVFVNDGSKDHTWQLIRQYHEENPMIQGGPSKCFAGGLDDSKGILRHGYLNGCGFTG